LDVLAAAAIADQAEATFGWHGPYDKCTEWIIAGAAGCGPHTIITDERRKLLYSKINGVVALTFKEYLEQHD
jgi:hypothetical protein